MINTVVISTKAKKDLHQLPAFIVRKLLAWIQDVEVRGLENVRMVPGYHDEPLKGQRKGQRSIRLNKAYRAIYTISENGTIEFVDILEVNKHDY